MMTAQIDWGKRLQEELLPFVTRPGQYLGCEFNSVHKRWEDCRVRMAFAFPDTYEVGMSYLGLQILYHIVNQEPAYLMERSFLPLPDMAARMRSCDFPLFSWESVHPLAEFDLLGFTLQYELSYTNILEMLELAGIPLLSRERQSGPLVVAGGPCAYNPEPLCDFIDIFLIGEGEEALPELLALVDLAKKEGWSRAALLAAAAKLDGAYVPAFYAADYDAAGGFSGLRPLADVPLRIEKRVLKDFSAAVFPDEPIVPLTETVHNRAVLEIMRGCKRGCRFCQAGMIYRPLRERDLAVLREQAARLVRSTGYDELGLISLSSADFSCISPLVDELLAAHAKAGVSVSLPSLRIDAFSVDLAERVSKVRKSGLTFAPEAGTQRLRDIINKGVNEEDLITAVSAACAAGWSRIKLYFMIGLPGEEMADLDGITELVRRSWQAAKAAQSGGKRRPLQITVSASSFVPKVQTPFQWCGQDDRETLKEKQYYLKDRLRSIPGVSFHYHDVETSMLEAVFARGDRRLGQVLLEARRLGCHLDGWTEHFRFDLWQQAFAAAGMDAQALACRVFADDAPLPWEHISCGVKKSWLLREKERARQGQVTAACAKKSCTNCGACGGELQLRIQEVQS